MALVEDSQLICHIGALSSERASLIGVTLGLLSWSGFPPDRSAARLRTSENRSLVRNSSSLKWSQQAPSHVEVGWPEAFRIVTSTKTYRPCLVPSWHIESPHCRPRDLFDVHMTAGRCTAGSRHLRILTTSLTASVPQVVPGFGCSAAGFWFTTCLANTVAPRPCKSSPISNPYSTPMQTDIGVGGQFCNIGISLDYPLITPYMTPGSGVVQLTKTFAKRTRTGEHAWSTDLRLDKIPQTF